MALVAAVKPAAAADKQSVQYGLAAFAGSQAILTLCPVHQQLIRVAPASVGRAFAAHSAC